MIIDPQIDADYVRDRLATFEYVYKRLSELLVEEVAAKGKDSPKAINLRDQIYDLQISEELKTLLLQQSVIEESR